MSADRGRPIHGLKPGVVSDSSAETAAIVMGASAGALDALSRVLRELPAEFPLPILAVVHLPPDKKSVMVELLQRICAIKVREAEDKEPIEAGVVYFAPPDYHLLVESDKRLSLSSEEPVQFSRPSIDVLFETAADAYGPALIGAILTGANSDGALGMKAVLAAGGRGLAQHPEQAHSSAMPQAALDAAPGTVAMSLEEIATHLKQVAHV